MNPLQLIPNRPQRARRPTSLDELHRRARRAVTKLTDSSSVASPALVVADIPVNSAGHAVSGQFRLLSAGLLPVPTCWAFAAGSTDFVLLWGNVIGCAKSPLLRPGLRRFRPS